MLERRQIAALTHDLVIGYELRPAVAEIEQHLGIAQPLVHERDQARGDVGTAPARIDHHP